MNCMYIIFVTLAIILVLGLVFMTVYIIKNIVVNNETQNKQEYLQSNDKHIKDFFDINSAKESKVVAYGDSFDEEVNTVGVDIDLIDNNKGKDAEKPLKKLSVKQRYTEKDNFINDYKTISLDTPPIRFNSDETVDMNSIKEKQSHDSKINVILKYKNGDANKIIKMTSSQITVGRDVSNDLLLKKDSFASRNHAIFILRDDKLYLRDLNSKNGTFINKNNKIEGEVLIEKSCEVKFADAVVEVQITD